MKSFKRTTIFFITLLILSFALSKIVLGIGQVTKPIVIKDVLRGQEVTTSLHLINSEDKEVVYELRAEGEIADWASFYEISDRELKNPINKIKIPPNSHLNVIVKFKIPNDIPNGEYKGEAVILTVPEAEEKGVSIRLRVGRGISIIVTDKEILKFDTAIIPLKYGIGKNEPLKIKVIYNNQGNVYIKPDIQLKIIQLSTGKVVHNAIYPYPEGENPVKPFERKVFENLIEWPTTGQENGRYKAEIKVLLDNKVIQEDDFRFTLGFDWSKFFAFLAFIGGGNVVLGWFVIGGIFFALAGILVLISKRNGQVNKFLKIGVIDRIKSIF